MSKDFERTPNSIKPVKINSAESRRIPPAAITPSPRRRFSKSPPESQKSPRQEETSETVSEAKLSDSTAKSRSLPTPKTPVPEYDHSGRRSDETNFNKGGILKRLQKQASSESPPYPRRHKIDKRESTTGHVKFPINKDPERKYHDIKPEETSGQKSGTIFRKNTSKRRELASFLWGEGEDDFKTEDTGHSPQETGTSSLESKQENYSRLPAIDENRTYPGSKQKQSSGGTDSEEEKSKKNRRFQRRECSFPGMLTILMPSETFQPTKIAIKVVDISPQGARLETRNLTDAVVTSLQKDKWYCRLEMLVPHQDKVRIVSRIAWVSVEKSIGEIGVRFTEDYLDIDSLFTDGMNAAHSLESIALRSPVLDSFPSVTDQKIFTFRGQAQDCDRILVTRGVKQFEAVPVAGRFDIEIPLSDNRTNFLSFTAIRDDQQSVPTPAVILQKQEISESISVHNETLVDEFLLSPDNKRLQVSLQGPPNQYFRALKRIEETLQYADEIFLTIDFHGKADKAAEKLETLKDEKQNRN